MADILATTSTTATLTLGGTVTGTLESGGDHDWYALSLTAGQWVVVTLTAGTFSDTNLNIRDSAGNIVFTNDDRTGSDLNSQVPFQAAYTGTYYVDASAYDSSSTGTYQISVQSFSPPPIATNDQIADQLVSGYWDGAAHRFNVTQGEAISVNINSLTPAEQTLARAALQEWADIIGVRFQEVTTGGQIIFDDSEVSTGPIATTNADWSGSIISSAQVHISTSWLTTYGSTINSYGFQTYVHEIGHALGLGHPGGYDEDAAYAANALFLNDGWSTTVMSYFDQQTNTYFAGKGFTFNYALTPMVADIIAMQKLYGLSTSTRGGDTTYGYNSTAGGVFSSIYPDAAYTIYDTGGTDTLDFSGSAAKQLLNLNAEAFSNVLGSVGNLSIARGVMIENAIGGTADDIIIGNAAGNSLTGGMGSDVLTGGAGVDFFKDTKAGHNGDTITDFGSGDQIVFTDATLGSFTYSLSGSTLTYSGGTLTLQGTISGSFSTVTAATGGVALTLTSATQQTAAHDDFNGDGRADILWRSDSGIVQDWLGQPNGGAVSNAGNLNTAVPTDWHIVGTGDFNGDGYADVLWRSDAGVVRDWLGQANGGFKGNVANLNTAVDPNVWHIAGTGDFNGDGRTDVLWRSGDGTVTEWTGQANGGFAPANLSVAVSNAWHVAGTGDFNGDGLADILWRSGDGTVTDWLGQANGGFAANASNINTAVPNDWQIVGTGDFNGDGRDDILWRGADGTLRDWLGQTNGAFAGNVGNFNAALSNSWHVVSIADFNGDGRDDLLLQNSAGTVMDWLGQANGSFVENSANLSANPGSTAWHVQDLFS